MHSLPCHLFRVAHLPPGR